MQGALNNIIAYGPNIIAALAILIIGWIVALIVSGIVRGVLRRLNVDQRLARSAGPQQAARPMPVSDWVSRIVYYLILLFVLVAFFQALGLTLIVGPLNALLALVLAYLPRIVSAGILLLIAWIVARVLRAVVLRVASAAHLDERLGSQAGPEAQAVPLSRTLAEIVYWLVFLLFLPPVLDALNLPGLLTPVQTLLNQILGFLPNLFAAAVILLIGWFVARIVQRIVSGLLAAIGTDRLAERVGLARALGQQTLSSVLGLVVYVLIFIPVVVAALNALQLGAVTQPISNMLNQILAAIPNIFAAVLVLALSYVIGRVVARLIANLLAGFGVDTLLTRMGMGQASSAGGVRLSEIIGNLVLAAIMLFATINALQLLGFGQVAVLVSQFLVFAGHIVVGLIIFALGLYLANLAARVVRASAGQYPELLATAARIAILVLAGAMALQQMGLANEIINLAFGLLLGAIAVAVALAFGLGGRDQAARLLTEWRQSLEQPRITTSLETPPSTPPASPPFGQQPTGD
jgi:hypothetical protein